jgi:hypothetical protein
MNRNCAVIDNQQEFSLTEEKKVLVNITHAEPLRADEVRAKKISFLTW